MKTSATVFCLTVALTLQVMASARHEGKRMPGINLHGQPAEVQGVLSEGYVPWAKQVSGLPANRAVGSFCAVDSNVVWAFSFGYGANAQIFTRTTNGGTSWSAGIVACALANYGCVSVYAFDALQAWVLMYDNSYRSGGGLARTTDGGATWKLDSTLFQVPGGSADFIHFFDANTGVCVGDPTNGFFEIYRTTDAGAQWARVPQANIQAKLPGEVGYQNEFSAAGSSLWFPTTSSTDGRVYRTTDMGATWSADVYPGLPQGWFASLEFQDENTGLGNGNFGEVRRTTDGGRSWTQIPTIPHFGWQHIEYVPGTSGMYVASLIIDYPDLTGAYLCGTAVTLDSGTSWAMAWQTTLTRWGDLRFVSSTVGWRSAYQEPDVYRWSIAGGRAISGPVDPLLFNRRDKGTSTDTIAFDVASLGSDPLTISSVSGPKGSHFQLIDPPTLPASPGTLHGLRLKVLFAPKERGQFADSLVVTSNAANAPTFVINLGGSALQFDDALCGPYMYGASDSIYTIAGNGAASLFGPLNTGSRAMNSLAINPVTSTLYGIYAGGTTSTLYRIDPFGPGARSGAVVPVQNMRAIAFSPTGTLFGASTAGKLYRVNPTTGDSTLVGIPGITIGSIAFAPSGKLYAALRTTAGNNDAIYTIDTTNGTATLVGNTGDGVLTPSITFDASGNMYGLKGYGAKINTIIQIDPVTGAGTPIGITGVKGLQSIVMLDKILTSLEDRGGSGIPQGFALRQNFPNPFNPVTRIGYTIGGSAGHTSGSARTTLAAYDILGRHVATLVDEVKAPGSYEVTFDGSGLASGVYFYRLTAGSFVQTMKMLMVK